MEADASGEPGARASRVRAAWRSLIATSLVCAAVTVAVPARAPASEPALRAPTQASTSATIAPSLLPARLGAKAVLAVTIRYTAGDLPLPSPVRRSVLSLPAGLTLDIPSLRSCATWRLLVRGPSGCPAQARIGTGHALLEVHAGSQYIAEQATLWLFLGPPRNLRPTFEILAQGYTPVDKRIVLHGSVLAGAAPYGEVLTMSVPPIPTLAFEPDASIVTFSLTLGARGKRGGAAVVVPSRCPPGGFPFAAEFTYADGSVGDALATVPCAPAPAARARAARAISLNETGRLRLTSKRNYTLNEQGPASGTVPGSIYVHLTAVSTSRVTAEVNIYARGGSITGHGTASYRRSGTTASFSGSMSFSRGTGSYLHVHGSGLSFSGTISESHGDAIVVHMRGTVFD